MSQFDYRHLHDLQNRAEWQLTKAQELSSDVVSDDVKERLVANAEQRLKVIEDGIRARDKADRLWAEIMDEPERAVRTQEHTIHCLINRWRHPDDNDFKESLDNLDREGLEGIESDLMRLLAEVLAPESEKDLLFVDGLSKFGADYLASKGLPDFKQILESPSVQAALDEIRALKAAEKTAERLA